MPRYATGLRSSASYFLYCAALVLLVLAAAVAKGTTPEPRWVQRHYGSIDGLPVGSASSARVDVDGFLWLATHDGLARFDGERFEVHDSMRFPAMSGNRVRSLHKGARGQLFAYTAHGDWLSVRSGRIERVVMGVDGLQDVRHVHSASLCLTTAHALHCPDSEDGFPPRVRFPGGVEPALALPGQDDTVWMVTLTGEIWFYRNGSWRRLPQPAGSGVARLPENALVATDGALWCDIYGQLMRVTEEGASIVEWPGGGSPQVVSQLRQDSRGNIWIGAINGLYLADVAQPRRAFPGGDGAPGFVYRSWEGPDNSLWVAYGGNLWRLDSLPETPAALPAPVLESSGSILDLLFGDDGTVWVMTLHDGIHRLNRARVQLLDKASGLGAANIYGVAQDSSGTMWLGSLGSGLRTVDRDGQVRRHGRSEGLPGENPWLVATAPDGSVYVATYAPGLWRRAPGSSRFEAVALPHELVGEQVLATVFDSAGRLWLGTTAGAWLQERAGWRRQWPAPSQRQRVNALALSGADIWFGGGEGVWRKVGDSGHPVAEALLSHTSVRDLYRASDGALWISTDGRGLVRVAADDPHGKRAIRMGRAEGLPSNSPHAVREDAHGHLWVNSNQGIFRINRNNLLEHLAGDRPQLSPLVLGLSDGLSELEGNGGVQPAAAFDAQGRLWFPSQSGIVRFDPLDMPLRERAPRAVIDGLESDGRILAPANEASLPLGVRRLLIHYGAADLYAGAQVRFRYRLLPQDQGWTDVADQRTAGFAHLGPGRYRFELLAGNSDGVWADVPTVFEFHVPHHWHETGTFLLLLLAGSGFLVLGLVRLRVQRLHLRTVKLDRQVRERTGQLLTEKARVETALLELSEAHTELARTHETIEDSNQRLAEQARRLEALDRFRSRVLADVSHELRTPVMLVTLPLRELQAHAAALDEADRRHLHLSLSQLDRLAGLVEQLVELVQAESGQLRLRASRIDLDALLGEIVAAYRPAAKRAGATLVLEESGSGLVLFGDRQHLITVFGNLIDNAIKYAPVGSRILVRTDRGEAVAAVEVRDEGPGFDPAVAMQLFERFYRVDGPPRNGREGLGIGLALARELVELHGGRIRADSPPGTGATFRVELPLGSAHVALDDLALDSSEAVGPLPILSPERGDGRVLLVEDHPDLAAYLAERLDEHLPVTCVGSAEAAAQALADDPGIRLVVSDVVLPGASGLDLCRQLTGAADERRRPVILISAKAAAADREAGLAAGAIEYLAKPFSFEALLNAMARAWPEAGPRLVAGPVDPSALDPLLAVALHGLDDSAFTIARWAAQAHLSERQLRRRVGDLTGQSPQTWLREQRLLRVRHLLRSGACKTLAEAGGRCGLDNPAWLYRSYRARFGEH